MNTSRKLLIETSEEGRKIIDYAMLTDKGCDLFEHVRSEAGRFRLGGRFLG